MKKRIFYVLSSLLIFTAPSMVQAEENGDTLTNEKTNSSHQSLLGIHTLTNLLDGLGSLLVKDSEPTASEQENQTETVQEALPVAETLETAIAPVESAHQAVTKDDQTLVNSTEVVAENVTTTDAPVPEEQALGANPSSEAPVTAVAEPKPLLSLGLLGLNINLLGGNASSTGLPNLLSIDASGNSLTSNSDLLNVNLGLGEVGNVGLDLLSFPTLTESGELSGNSGLLGLNVTESALLGDLNVGLLSGSKNLTEDGYTSSLSLANLGINNPLLNTNVGVLEQSKNVSGDTTTFSSSIVSAGVSAPLIGELNTTIGGVSGLISPDRNEFHSGLVSADINNDILGDNHVGIIEHHVIETAEGTTETGGLVIVDGDHTPVGDIHIGVGEVGNPVVVVVTPIPEGPTTQPGTGENETPSTGSTTDPTTGGQAGGNGSGSSTDENQENGTGIEVIVKPTNPIESNVLPGNIEDTTNPDQELAFNSQNNELVNGDTSAVGQFFKTLLDAGNQTILNQGVDEAIQFGLEIEKANEKSANTTAVTTLTAPSTSSSSSSTGSASISGGSGASVVLDSGYNLETLLNIQTQNILKTLSTQWTESPPVQPPMAPFFLSI
ncbi:hypothetical protein HHO41_02655 [Bacillus sp. DNRA2]|uniref:hypothetical protein n=1 Tax=Bacillus sp. DNRA2 TaxID=2723053 RepID=UPI00145DA97C|nr:hypothetical protein [Bacillus sp. DNRA2]NMD69174.1 hypothetical protein [Bacillus sp. DNRA2]